ncbi:hypothetical protein GUJ93_ZPchr0011g28204 [Zizania palustris]|uniref:Rapid ALkalinization Factor n=1 Tax=Zizania palustris TaxID=103762 RepID=A0A8J5WEH4_ZIZPA|nr:hypothetical protein GUJ93_ZPchr0011g27099 [Zizania palustris]KAG8089783.1 hypothetical protein GUJ93_ZPchr0011g28204 [Zizania palustris]
MKLLLLISSVVAVALLLLSSGGAAGGALITADHGAVAVVGGMMLVRHIEDDLSSLEMESAAYPQPQRRVLQEGINYKPLNANKPACDGNCPARGNSYTGRGCQSKYKCSR